MSEEVENRPAQPGRLRKLRRAATTTADEQPTPAPANPAEEPKPRTRRSRASKGTRRKSGREQSVDDARPAPGTTPTDGSPSTNAPAPPDASGPTSLVVSTGDAVTWTAAEPSDPAESAATTASTSAEGAAAALGKPTARTRKPSARKSRSAAAADSEREEAATAGRARRPRVGAELPGPGVTTDGETEASGDTQSAFEEASTQAARPSATSASDVAAESGNSTNRTAVQDASSRAPSSPHAASTEDASVPAESDLTADGQACHPGAASSSTVATADFVAPASEAAPNAAATGTPPAPQDESTRPSAPANDGAELDESATDNAANAAPADAAAEPDASTTDTEADPAPPDDAADDDDAPSQPPPPTLAEFLPARLQVPAAAFGRLMARRSPWVHLAVLAVAWVLALGGIALLWEGLPGGGHGPGILGLVGLLMACAGCGLGVAQAVPVARTREPEIAASGWAVAGLATATIGGFGVVAVVALNEIAWVWNRIG